MVCIADLELDAEGQLASNGPRDFACNSARYAVDEDLIVAHSTPLVYMYPFCPCLLSLEMHSLASACCAARTRHRWIAAGISR